jgi:deoxyribonuclease-4
MKKESKLLIGAHTSGAGGLFNALLEGQRIGATTIQLFTSNQKQWKGRQLTEEDISLWNRTLAETGLKEIMSHDSYLINLGSPNPELLEKSRQCFKEEIHRCHQLGITYLNFHPGARLTDTEEQCLDRIAESILSLEKEIAKGKTRLLLEATAGQGSSVGYKFEHLGYLIKLLEKRVPIGVCIDTCHIFAAGYDIRTPDAWKKTLDEFDRVVGLKHLYAFHINDSAKGLGTRVDRHAEIGDGLIGIDAFRFLVTDPKSCRLPMYLETPGGPELWVKEIAMLKDYAH